MTALVRCADDAMMDGNDIGRDEFPCAVAWHPKGDFFVVPTRTHGMSTHSTPLCSVH